MLWIYCTSLLFGIVWCQNNIPIDLQDIEKSLGEIPGLQNVDKNAVPTLDEIENALKKKCDKNGAGSDAIDKLYDARDALQDCIQSNFDFQAINAELQEARKTGSMDEVFAKYCLKAPIVQKCFQNMTDTLETCLAEDEKATLKVILNVTYSLTDFLCYKDGDRLAMFVAEGGFECIQEKSVGLQGCLNRTVGDNVPNLTSDDLPSLTINVERCSKYDELQECAVNVLEDCQDTTPANIVEALFKYVRRITPCHELLPRRRIQRDLNRSRRQAQNPGNNVLGQAYDNIKNKYEPYCRKNGGDRTTMEFKEELINVQTCQSNVMGRFAASMSKNHDESVRVICNDVNPSMRSCIGGLTSKLTACLSSQEKYVPRFGLEVYDSVFKTICKDDGKVLKKLLHNDVCFEKLVANSEHCTRKTRHIKTNIKDAVVTKGEMCSDVKILKDCFLDLAREYCPGETASHDNVVELGNAVHAPCTGCTFLLSNFLLLVLLLTKFL